MWNTCFIQQHFTCEILNYAISHVNYVFPMWKPLSFICEMKVSLVKTFQFHILFTHEMTWNFRKGGMMMVSMEVEIPLIQLFVLNLTHILGFQDVSCLRIATATLSKNICYFAVKTTGSLGKRKCCKFTQWKQIYSEKILKRECIGVVNQVKIRKFFRK